MKKFTFRILIATIFCFVFTPQSMFAQYTSTKIKTKHEQYTDSLKQVKYDYVFPVLGQGAYKKGFDIPYPVGVMTNYFWMQQDLVFTNFELGFKGDNMDIPLTPADDLIQFGQNINTSYSFNVRPDVWVLPFLNVYGLFGKGTTETEVNIVVPVEFQSIVEQGFTTTGVGVMLAGGIGPVWLSVDANWTWNKSDLLEDPTLVSVVGLRLGHTFVFKNNPKRNFAVWAGGMRLEMASETVGEIVLKDAIPEDFWATKDQFVDDYWGWYDGLDPGSPIDQKKIEFADNVLTPIVDNIDNADGDGIVRYGMAKQTKELWNGIIGAQFQLDKHWQFRTEGGIVGNRKSFLFSVNYRFLL